MIKKEQLSIMKQIIEKRKKKMDDTEKEILVPIEHKGFKDMDHTQKQILKEEMQKELQDVEDTEIEIEFPSGNFIKSREMYEQLLNDIIKEIK